jgi:hypothetical protein
MGGLLVMRCCLSVIPDGNLLLERSTQPGGGYAASSNNGFTFARFNRLACARS